MLMDEIIWFDDDDYLNAEVSFPSGSVWRFDKKIKEHDYCEPQDMEQLGTQSETRGAFICSKVSGDGPPTAFIKIRLQIPWYGTGQEKPRIRAQQASSRVPDSLLSEVEALSQFTKVQCTSTPSLLAWKKEEQADDEWVPGGYKLYILMEHVPGSDPSHLLPPLLEPELPRKRDEVRVASKRAWLGTVERGLRHNDPAVRNLVWDERCGKCYLVDWERWSSSDEKTVWADRLYIRWNLARAGPSRNYSDMSDWHL